MDELHKLKSRFGLGSRHSAGGAGGWTQVDHPGQGHPQQQQQRQQPPQGFQPPYYPQQQSQPVGWQHPQPGEAASYYNQAQPMGPRPSSTMEGGRHDEYDMIHDRPPPLQSRPDQSYQGWEPVSAPQAFPPTAPFPPVPAPNVDPSTRPAAPQPPPFSSLPPNRQGSDRPHVHRPHAGTLYPPGKYPTPDLFRFPLSRHKTLSDPPSYTSVAIQEALDSLGPHATLYLPPKTRWAVSSTIWLREHQELATLEYPTAEDDLAWLEAEEGCTGHILSGANMPGVRIRNIGVEGGREKYGYSKANDCMVQLGNSKGFNQVIDHCMIRHPRQWSCLQVFQGSENVRVTNNLIGPAGYDEDAEEGGHWADGISYAGQNGLVAGNRIEDATDGGIVVFGAPGTLVTSNTIVSCCRMGLGAINMVDHGPHDGNYLGTRVIHNTIVVDGAYLKIGIGQGPSVWFAPPEGKPRDYIRGATVKFNLITTGDGSDADEDSTPGAVGYGFPVTDVDDWICTDNQVSPSVEFSGDMSRMSRDPRAQTIGPGAFVCARSQDGRGPKNSQLQPDFVAGPIGRLLDIRPGTSSYRVFWPGQLSLAMGKSILLDHLELAFDMEGVLQLREVQGGRILWSTPTNAGHRQGERPAARLILDPHTGRLLVVEGSNLLTDLTPNVPNNSASSVDDIVFTLSDTHPHILLASSNTGSVFFAPTGYQAEFQWQARQGSFICQTTPDDQHTLLAMLNQYGQYVILQTVSGRELPGSCPPTWPPDPTAWNSVWESHDVRQGETEDPKSHMIWQGDGNLVIYSGNDGHGLWSSGSCGRDPTAKHVRWGRGTPDDPLLSCVSDGGTPIWTSDRGLVV